MKEKIANHGVVQLVAVWWKGHPSIAQFITYFMVGNLATIVQFILVPVLQVLLRGTRLMDVDVHFLGPIGDPGAITTVVVNGIEIVGLNPYYVFNFTAGPVNTLVEKTLNGISGVYLAHGGMAYFLAMFIPLIISQVISFFMHRRVTFKSHGNIVYQAIWYFIAFCIITIASNALYALSQPWLYSVVGENLGGLIAAFLQCCIAFWVFFPILKIIFPESKDKDQCMQEK